VVLGEAQDLTDNVVERLVIGIPDAVSVRERRIRMVEDVTNLVRVFGRRRRFSQALLPSSRSRNDDPDVASAWT
jgi:hypothetical protein